MEFQQAGQLIKKPILLPHSYSDCAPGKFRREKGDLAMPVEITVGPPVLTINQGNTFMVTDLNGEISSGSEQGVFSGDTRFLSVYKIFANGVPWQYLSSATVTYYASRIHAVNHAFET